MDERNCGFCNPCAAGRYDECEMRKEEKLRDSATELLNALQQLLEHGEKYLGLGEIEGKGAELVAQAKTAIAKAKGIA